MATLQLRRLGKTYPTGETAVVDLDLDVDDGEICVLVGPSGCGKTTVLRMVAGLEDPTAGDVVIGGERANHLAPQQRDVAMAFQHDALYPHMTVRENIGFPLRMAGCRRTEVDRRVDDIAAGLELTDLLDRRPRRLSGGQRQRVALARAVIRQPRLFLMDEPLSSLDAKLRTTARSTIARIQRRLGTTALYVTHDQVEAMALADHVVVLRAGRAVQRGAPMELYDEPRDLFVAQFLGSPPMSTAIGILVDDEHGPAVDLGHVRIPLDGTPAGSLARAHRGARVALGIRPEACIADDGGPIVASVRAWEHLGHQVLVHAELPGTGLELDDRGRPIEVDRPALRALLPIDVRPDLYRPLRLRLDPRGIHVFDLATGATLRPGDRGTLTVR